MEEGNKSGAAACWQGCLPSSIPAAAGAGPAPRVEMSHAGQFMPVGSLRLTSDEQREGFGPGIGLNEGNSDVFILQAERGSGPLLLHASLPAVALTTGESRTWPRAGNFRAGEPGAAVLAPPAPRQPGGSLARSVGLLHSPTGLSCDRLSV